MDVVKRKKQSRVRKTGSPGMGDAQGKTQVGVF